MTSMCGCRCICLRACAVACGDPPPPPSLFAEVASPRAVALTVVLIGERLLEDLEGVSLSNILVRACEAGNLTFRLRDRVTVHLLHHAQHIRGLGVVGSFVLHEVDTTWQRQYK